jgi:hypothetical protein
MMVQPAGPPELLVLAAGPPGDYSALSYLFTAMLTVGVLACVLRAVAVPRQCREDPAIARVRQKTRRQG